MDKNGATLKIKVIIYKLVLLSLVVVEGFAGFVESGTNSLRRLKSPKVSLPWASNQINRHIP